MHIDLHNHTALCRHATGTMEEYIIQAIAQNIDIFGFSCHAPMAFDEAYRMNLAELPQYLREITRLQEKFKDKITILSALEVDYILHREDLIESSLLSQPFDYLIGSVHFLESWGFDNPAFIGEYAKRDIEQCWSEYLCSIAQMAQTGFFQIVGHLDLLKLFGHTMPDSQIPYLNRALESIADNHLAIELNAAGWRKPIKECYPSAFILEKAFQKGIDITFGSDAHSVEHIGFRYNDLCALAKSVGYTHALYFSEKQPIKVVF
ncbi:histidinol-phosphatase [Helicobacter mastomyrinus]|uniref:Histidinol-phosphatase n=1 Tax=Helicobacter mastomyrinus TaxID=287948 RepID=A0ABZ3F4Z6_9HELI|nr:histidinol-phosphatase [uncultured Helicobacter sp.]